MSDREDHNEDNGYVSGDEDRENEENSDVNSVVRSDDEEEEEEERVENSEVDEDNEEDDSQEDSSDYDREVHHGLKRRGGRSSMRSKRQALHNLVDSEAHESSDDSKEYSMDKNLDEVFFFCISYCS